MLDVRIRALTSLAKVFPNEYPPYMECKKVTAFQNEPAAFQVAACLDFPYGVIRCTLQVENTGLETKLYRVECIPSELPCYANYDKFVLSTKPGLYPDLLRPIDGETETPFRTGVWNSFYIEMPGLKKPGKYTVKVSLCGKQNGKDKLYGTVSVPVEILPAQLPKQKLLFTNWFHSDCLSTWYKVEPMSEEYWRITENFARVAHEHGLTVLLTPVFTPPLDTKIGSERPTVQLVDVTVTNGKYSFGFEKLHRWIEMCHRVGIENFEISHLFTQWGAAHAPKVMATVDGEYKRIFGWETDSLGQEYCQFLKAFSAALNPFLEKEGVAEHCYFHVSDEPSDEVREHYAKCADVIRECFPGRTVIDALSHTSYYEQGVIKVPVPSTSAVEAFEPLNVEHKWCYYCCGQYYNLSNRFFNMSQARTRILGMQLYKYNMEGFLQWGYNFWYSQLSVRPIDPFKVSDAGYAFPSGDAYVVYPGENGEPMTSLRLKAFYEGFNDMRALQMLEGLIGRSKVLKMLEKDLANPLTFTEFPHTEDWMIAKRDEINRRIMRELKKQK